MSKILMYILVMLIETALIVMIVAFNYHGLIPHLLMSIFLRPFFFALFEKSDKKFEP